MLFGMARIRGLLGWLASGVSWDGQGLGLVEVVKG